MDKDNQRLPELTPFALWALSLGSTIGWGSLVVTCSSYLSQAGIVGSVLGLLIGFVMMLMVSSHYHFLSNRHPGPGGLYGYVKSVMGNDASFLAAWFMFLVYMAIFWANATSIPLFARYFFRGIFRFGYLYTIFGYEVYLGEALLTLAAIIAIATLCTKSRTASDRSMQVMVLVFTVGITFCAVAALIGHGKTGMSFEPAFIPDKSAIRQILRIAFISPWAFIGFESITNNATGCRIRQDRMFRILVVSVSVSTVLYILTMFLSVSAFPEGCNGWLDYIGRLDEFEGIAGLPAFFAARYYLGDAGVYILMASLMSLVLTSLIGMLRAVSRLAYAVSRDGIIGPRFSKLNSKGIPANAIQLAVAVSIPIPFVGRTAIGWIVDTTTIGATLLYGLVSFCVFKVSQREKSSRHRVMSTLCLIILAVFLVFLLFPEFFSDQTIESETYVLLTVWSLLGIIIFNTVIRKDHARHFGKAIIVWIILMIFVVSMTMAWVERLNEKKGDEVVDRISAYYDGTADSALLALDEQTFLESQRDELHNADLVSSMVIISLFFLALGVLLVNHLSMRKWEKQASDERDQARTVAYTDALTGVKSKHAFDVHVGRIEDRIALGESDPFAVVVCDVNGLKQINDTLGHKAGDEYIIEACMMLCESFKHSPVFRIGGDEFVVLVQGPDYGTRLTIMDQLNARIEKNVGTDEVVMSLGMAVFTKETDHTFQTVFARADSLMYERKTHLKSMGAEVRN